MAYQVPNSFAEAIANARSHLNTPLPQGRDALLNDKLKSNTCKLALELFTMEFPNGMLALQTLRATPIYKALRERMEVAYFNATGAQLPQ